VSGAVAMGWGECVRAGRMGPGSKVGSDLGWPDGDRRAGIGGRVAGTTRYERRLGVAGDMASILQNLASATPSPTLAVRSQIAQTGEADLEEGLAGALRGWGVWQ